MRARAAAVGVVLGFLSGCSKSPPPSRFPSADDALARMKATFGCANGVQAHGKLDHFGERGRIRGEVIAIAVNPARVRVEITSPFGATPYTLTSDGISFALNDLPNKQFLVGPASACNLARLVQVPVPGHALVYLLRGEAPLLVHERATASLGWEDGRYRVDIPSAHGAAQTVLLEVYDEDFSLDWSKQRVRVTGVTTMHGGSVVYQAKLGRFTRVSTAPARVDEDGVEPPIPPSGGPCELDVPRSIRLEVPMTGDDVLFQYDRVALNPPLPVGTFTQPEPAGSLRVPVECRDR
ncbi:MAG: hypothetical protein FJ095_11120 [Deltaproteobacteria bacterium]|nr:hypothetical protein [Deltaproteobacteria bacterium]